MKRLIILFLLIPSICWGSSISRDQYSTGDSVTADNLNTNFNVPYNVLNGGLDNDNADTDNGFRFIEILAAVPSAGNQGRVVFSTGDNTLYFDTGTSMIAVAVLANDQTFTGTNIFSGDVKISGLTNTRVTFAGASGVLTDDDDLTFATDTLTATKIGAFTAAGAIDFNSENMTNVDIDSGTVDGIDLAGGDNQGDIWYDNGTTVTRLIPSTAGRALKTGGATANPSWGDFTAIKIYTSDDTFVAPANITTVYLTMVGGGGGGAGINAGNEKGGGGGAGGGSIINFPHTVIGGNSYTVDVGAKGSGGVGTGAPGGNGANSTFDTTVIALGGPGGIEALTGGTGSGGFDGSDSPGGTGGAGGGQNIKGGDGGDGQNASNGDGGGGGGSPFGAGGAGGTDAAGSNATGYGSGGGGASDGGGGNHAGGDGTDGLIIVLY